jgi:hypothetical protein
MAEIVGAAYDHEITLMNSLTVNLHLMMQVSSLFTYIPINYLLYINVSVLS